MKKNIPQTEILKKYILLGTIYLVTILLTIYLCRCYYIYNQSKQEIPVIRGTLSEITYQELDHYLLENPTAVIYMCTSDSLPCRTFEKDFKKLIARKNLQDEIIYLNLTNVNLEEFIKEFNQKYIYRIKLENNCPILVNFDAGKVTNILQESEGELSISKVKQFIEINQIGE